MEISTGNTNSKFWADKELDKHCTPLILAPGGPGLSHKYLQYTSHLIQDEFNVIFFDPIGTGSSETGIPEEWSIEQNTSSISHILGSKALDKVVLIGHSAGAVDALKYASENPSKVSHLVLLNPVIGPLLRSITSNPVFGEDDLAANLAHKFWVKRDFSELALYLEKVMPYYEPIAPTTEYLSTLNINIDKFLACIDDYLDFDYKRHLKALDIPTLICFGQHDPLIIANEGKNYINSLGNEMLDVRIFKKSGHTITLTEEPKLLTELKLITENS